jgi:hypothetical protein
VRALLPSLLAGACLAVLLSGCESAPLVDAIPGQVGGLPAATPARPAEPYKYPAVHDMPPPRATDPLTEEQQYRLEKELQAVRDRQAPRKGAKKEPTATN